MNTNLRLALCLAMAAGALGTACASSPPAPAPLAPVAAPSVSPVRRAARVQVTDPQIAPQQNAQGPTPEQESARIRLTVLKEVEGHYPELIECYDRGRDHDGGLQGRISVRFTVAPSGDVVGLSDGGGTTIVDRAVVACVQGAFTRMKFVAWEGKAVSATLPIDFSSPQ